MTIDQSEETAKNLAKTMSTAGTHGTAGFVNVKTESWSSKDGIGRRSEKSKSWGPGIEHLNLQILYNGCICISKGITAKCNITITEYFLPFVFS